MGGERGPRGGRTRRVSATRPARLVADGRAHPRRPHKSPSTSRDATRRVPTSPRWGAPKTPRDRPPAARGVDASAARPRRPAQKKRKASIQSNANKANRRSCTHALTAPTQQRGAHPRSERGGEPPTLRDAHHGTTHPVGDQPRAAQPMKRPGKSSTSRTTCSSSVGATNARGTAGRPVAARAGVADAAAAAPAAPTPATAGRPAREPRSAAKICAPGTRRRADAKAAGDDAADKDGGAMVKGGPGGGSGRRQRPRRAAGRDGGRVRGGGGPAWRCSDARGKRVPPRERGSGRPKDAGRVGCVGAFATRRRGGRDAARGPSSSSAGAHHTRARQARRSAAPPPRGGRCKARGARGRRCGRRRPPSVRAARGASAPRRRMRRPRSDAARDQRPATRRCRWGSVDAPNGATGGAVAADGHNLPRSWHPRSAMKVVSAWALQPLAGPPCSLQKSQWTSPPAHSKVGMYQTLRFWKPFPDRYTDLTISYRDLGTLILLITPVMWDVWFEFHSRLHPLSHTATVTR